MDYAKRRASTLIGKAPRVDKHEGSQCDVFGCSKTCRAFSRYCARHASVYYRTRNPTGRMPRLKEVIPYREQASFALEVYGLGSHPAIVAAEQTLERMIANPGAMPEPYARHWRRLNEGGATGRAMLLQILSVYGMRQIGLRDVFTDDHVFFAFLGSRFLRTVSLGWYTTSGGKREQVRLPGLEAESVGLALADKVGGLALLFWDAVEREYNQRAREAMSIREALDQTPL